MKISSAACAFALAIAFGAADRVKADDTFVYAVQISAIVQTNPPQITLDWEPDPYGAKSYTIYRKAKTGTTWGDAMATLGGSITNWSDTNVIVGSNYEYEIY